MHDTQHLAFGHCHRFGSDAIELTYKDAAGKVGNELLYRDREADLEIVEEGHPWSFDGDGARSSTATASRASSATACSTVIEEVLHTASRANVAEVWADGRSISGAEA